MPTCLNKTTKTSKKLSVIKLENVSVNFNDLTALKDVSLNINKGDYVYILGPNGAGKSTLIRLLSNLLKPSEGNIDIKCQNVGYLPQMLNRKPNFPITVEEVIYTGFRKQNLKISKDERKLINEWLDIMELSNISKKLMSTLSGGQQQRIYIIRALISNPDLLILDEPTSALDPSFRNSFNNLLKKLNKDGTTILYVTHDIHEDSINHDSKIIYIDQKVKFDGCYDDYKKIEGDYHV